MGWVRKADVPTIGDRHSLLFSKQVAEESTISEALGVDWHDAAGEGSDASSTVDASSIADTNSCDQSISADGRSRPSSNRSVGTELSEDFLLLGCFLDLCKLPHNDDDVARQVVEIVGFLYKCSYSEDDLCSILAHASAYYCDLLISQATGAGPTLDSSCTLTVLAYMAHVHVVDETCRLRIWCKYLFKAETSVKHMDTAVMHFMKGRGYILRVEAGDLRRRYLDLLLASRGKAPVRSEIHCFGGPCSAVGLMFRNLFNRFHVQQ